MLNFRSIMIGSEDSNRLGQFYKEILAQEPDPTMMQDGWYGWQIGSGWLTVGPHSEVHGTSKESPRIMLIFETKEVKEEFERMRTAGAIVVKEPYEMGGSWIATLADLDGNYFQLMTPFEDQS